jgi:hypothetical protein
MFKSGVILATVAAGLLATSPLAFAGENHHGGSSHHKKHDRDDDNDRNDRGGKRSKGDCGGDINQVNAGRSGGGLINVSNVNLGVPVNVCNNDILSGVLGILSKDLRNNDNHR